MSDSALSSSRVHIQVLGKHTTVHQAVDTNRINLSSPKSQECQVASSVHKFILATIERDICIVYDVSTD